MRSPEREPEGPPQARPRRWVVPSTLFVSALALRLAHLATVRSSPYFHRLWLDLAFFDEWGMRIAAGQWRGLGHFYQDPLYPYFLGSLYWVFGHKPIVVVAIQLVLGSTVPIIVYDAVRRGFGPREGIVAGAIAALYAPSIFYEGLVLKSWMDVFIVASALAVMARAIDRQSRAMWVLAGLMFGVACLDRGNLILVVPALAGWLALDSSTSPSLRGGRERLALVTVFLAGVGLILGGSAARNRIAGGEWILTTAQAGQNFYLGNNPWATAGEYDPPPFLRSNPKYEEGDFAAEALRRTGREMTPGELSRFWFRQGVAWIVEHPGNWLRLTYRKIRSFFGAYEVPDNIDFYDYRRWAPILRLPLPGFGSVAPLALLGALLSWRRPGWARALLVFLVVYAMSVVLFFVFARYRLAAMPVLFAFAGVGTVALWDRARSALRGAGTGKLVRTALAWAVCVGFVNLPVRLPADDPIFRLASSVGLPTRAASDATECFNLGVSYAKEGDLTRAENELRRALAEEPNRAVILVELGKVLARAGRTNEAIAMFSRAVTLEPGNPVWFHTLGILYRRSGRRDEAATAFREEQRLRAYRMSGRGDPENGFGPR